MTRMSQSFTPLPQHAPEREIGLGRIVVWVLLLATALIPRLWILGFWIFSREIGDAFSSWVVPAIGFLILPWTTLFYAFMWSIDSDGVHGLEWAAVAVALLVDVLFWAVGRRSLRW